jgi:heme-degrading monooxygenase HmoA
MAIRVMIKRWVPAQKAGDLYALITELRSMASKQPGYISGETMRSATDPEEYLVISTWDSLEDWNNWIASKPRKELQGRIDTLLGGSPPTTSTTTPKGGSTRRSPATTWSISPTDQPRSQFFLSGGYARGDCHPLVTIPYSFSIFRRLLCGSADAIAGGLACLPVADGIFFPLSLEKGGNEHDQGHDQA